MNLFAFIVTVFIILPKIKAAPTETGAERPKHHRGDPRGEPNSQRRNRSGKFGLRTSGTNLEDRKGQEAHLQKQQVEQRQKLKQKQIVAEQVKQVLKQLRHGLLQVARLEPKKVLDEKKKRRGQSWSWPWKVQSQDSRAELHDSGGGSHGTLVSKGW